MRNSIYCLLCNEEKNIVDFIASIDGQLGSIKWGFKNVFVPFLYKKKLSLFLTTLNIK